MKKKKLSLKALKIDDSIELISKDELMNFIGGSGSGSVSNDCVFNVFDYLDGSAHDYNTYYYGTFYNLGYTPSGSGGVQTSDIPTIGGFGGMQVTELQPGVSLTASGKTTGGDRVMMTFSGANGADHAVVVTGALMVNGTAVLSYYDPTTGTTGTKTGAQISGLYAVGAVGSAGSGFGGSGS